MPAITCIHSSGAVFKGRVSHAVHERASKAHKGGTYTSSQIRDIVIGVYADGTFNMMRVEMNDRIRSMRDESRDLRRQFMTMRMALVERTQRLLAQSSHPLAADMLAACADEMSEWMDFIAGK